MYLTSNPSIQRLNANSVYCCCGIGNEVFQEKEVETEDTSRKKRKNS